MLCMHIPKVIAREMRDDRERVGRGGEGDYSKTCVRAVLRMNLFFHFLTI